MVNRAALSAPGARCFERGGAAAFHFSSSLGLTAFALFIYPPRSSATGRRRYFLIIGLDADERGGVE